MSALVRSDFQTFLRNHRFVCCWCCCCWCLFIIFLKWPYYFFFFAWIFAVISFSLSLFFLSSSFFFSLHSRNWKKIYRDDDAISHWALGAITDDLILPVDENIVDHPNFHLGFIELLTNLIGKRKIFFFKIFFFFFVFSLMFFIVPIWIQKKKNKQKKLGKVFSFASKFWKHYFFWTLLFFFKTNSWCGWSDWWLSGLSLLYNYVHVLL